MKKGVLREVGKLVDPHPPAVAPGVVRLDPGEVGAEHPQPLLLLGAAAVAAPVLRLEPLELGACAARADGGRDPERGEEEGERRHAEQHREYGDTAARLVLSTVGEDKNEDSRLVD